METIIKMVMSISIMYAIVAILGVYLLCMAVRMRKTLRVDKFIIPEEVLRNCKDERTAALILAKALTISSVILIFGGSVLALNHFMYELGNWSYPVVAMVLIAFGYFYKTLTDVKIKYC